MTSGERERERVAVHFNVAGNVRDICTVQPPCLLSRLSLSGRWLQRERGGGRDGGGERNRRRSLLCLHLGLFASSSCSSERFLVSIFPYFFEESVFFSFLFFIPFYLFIFFSPPPSLFKLNAKLYTLLCVVLLVFLSRLSPISLLFAFHLALFLPLLSS